MQNALCLESKLIAEDLYAVLQALDPSAWRADIEAAVRERMQSLSTRLHTALEAYQLSEGDHRLTRLYQRLSDIARLIEEMAPTWSLSSTSLPVDWQSFRRRAYPAYEALAASLRSQAIHVPSLRPTNYARNIFHVTSGLAVLLLVQHLLTPLTMVIMATAFTILAWNLEFFRRRSDALNLFLTTRVFGRVIHPHEHHRVNSATWYVTALLLLALFTSPLVASLAVVVLAVADPAAAVVGRRFGRIRIRAGRSLEGTLTFVLAGALASLATLAIYYPELGLGTMTALALAGAVAGALAELYSQNVDDNFTIPVSVAVGAGLMALWLGI